jgi:quinol monooxygenase YgiN
MHYILTARCQVRPGEMETFLRDVQQWEEDAMGAPAAPEYHALYLNRADPSHALIVTHFSNKEHADSFAGTGFLDRFRESILSCAIDHMDAEGYDLYYAAGPGGPRAIFGEES